MHTQDVTAERFEVLKDLNGVFREAIHSLDGKCFDPELLYVLDSALHVSSIVEAYCALRESGMVYASKLLVRPALETTASALAALRNPDFLFCKVFSEHEEQKKLLKGLMDVLEPSDKKRPELEKKLEEHKQGFEDFKNKFASIYLGRSRNEQRINAQDTLRLANLEGYYAQYRLYCQFAHGAWNAMTGDMDAMTDQGDNLLMADLVFRFLGILKTRFGVELPDTMSEITKRFLGLIASMAK